MRLAIILLLNAGLAGIFLRWLWLAHRRAGPGLRRWLLPALAWRLLLTALSTHWPSPDLAGPVKWSRLLADFFWSTRPGCGPRFSRPTFSCLARPLLFTDGRTRYFTIKYKPC